MRSLSGMNHRVVLFAFAGVISLGGAQVENAVADDAVILSNIKINTEKCPNGECVVKIYNDFATLRGNIRGLKMTAMRVNVLIDPTIARLAEKYKNGYLTDSDDEMTALYLYLVNSIFMIHKGSLLLPNTYFDPEMRAAVEDALANAILIANALDWDVIQSKVTTDAGAEKIVYMLKSPGAQMTRVLAISMLNAVKAIRKDRNLTLTGGQGDLLTKIEDASQWLSDLPEDAADTNLEVNEHAKSIIDGYDQGYFTGTDLAQLDQHIFAERTNHPDTYANYVQFKFFIANFKEHKKYGMNLSKLPSEQRTGALTIPTNAASTLSAIEIPVTNLTSVAVSPATQGGANLPPAKAAVPAGLNPPGQTEVLRKN